VNIFFCTKALFTSLAFSLNAQAPYPPDISFCIVDLKYNKPNLKICEFGEGIYSGFYGYDCLMGKASMWKHFREFLKSQNIPLFFLNKKCKKKKDYCATTTRLTTIVCRDLSMLEDNALFQALCSDEKNKGPSKNITDALGLVISEFPHHVARSLQKKHPSLIILDDATRTFVLSKLMTQLLFIDDPELERYRPQCVIVPKRYAKGMAKQIINKLKSQYCVIKPTGAYKGRGILFVPTKDLETTLAVILQPDKMFDVHTKELPHGQPYGYWRHDKSNYAMVESCETSQPIEVEGKHYDATMRVAFGITYEQGVIDTTFFGAYWKLPTRALEGPGSIAQKSQSHIRMGKECSAKVDPKTYQEVTSILRKILPRVYLKMIAARHSKELFTYLKHGLSSKNIP
jgi:hypothetical protein